MVYEKDFTGYSDEAPLSDGGQWTHPGAGQLDAQCKSGVVCGNGKNSGGNDCVRILSGFGPDVDMTVTLWSTASPDDYSHENELLFRAVGGTAALRCYEVLHEGSAASGTVGAYVVRWHGDGNYDVLTETGSENVTFPVTLRSRIVGKYLTVWINGVQKFVQDVTEGGVGEYTDGNPGVGFYSSGGSTPGADPQTGFTYLKADDGIPMGEELTVDLTVRGLG